jgi:2-dehydropantoate 2-reductase
MRILVIGAGAIGGLLAARLALAGHDVGAVARGAHLDAMRARGHLRLETRDGVVEAPVRAYATAQDAPHADVVIVTLKSHQLPALVEPIAQNAMGAHAFVPIQNGIPWWYFQHTTGPHAGRVVRAVDPDGRVAGLLAGAPVVPGFALVAAEIIAPGQVFHQKFPTDTITLGPLAPANDGAASIAGELLRSAGFEVQQRDVRREVWRKLLGNIWANPVGALTRASIDRIATHAVGKPLALALMRETEDVARAFGIDPELDFEQRLERARRVRQGVKSSMLQDVERGRETEHRAILGALVELADLAGLDVPRARTLHACMELLDEQRSAHAPR